MIIPNYKSRTYNETEMVNDITKQIVRYLFSQYLNISDQPIGFKWSDFNERMNNFCQQYFLKSFDNTNKEKINKISSIIQFAVNEECNKIMMEYPKADLPTKKIIDEVDLLNSIYFDTTVSLLNSFYHQDYFSHFFEYDISNTSPSISYYLDVNRSFLKQEAINRLIKLCSLFNIDDIDKKILMDKVNKYYSISM